MSRGLAVLAAAGACGVLAAPAPARPAPDPDPERALVRAVEFDLTLSKTKLRPGRAIIQFLNDGEDPHDLRMQRTDLAGQPEFGLGVIGPGEYENLDTRLRRRSTYTLWCSLAGHRGLGMEASLRIKRRKRR